MPTIVRASRKASESTISSAIRRAVSSMHDVILWRNNVGVLEDKRGVPVSYGLCVGSADLVGLLRVRWPGSGGEPYARFLAIEVKRPGGHGPTDEQAYWLALVRRMGGIAGVAYTVGEALDLIERGRKWEL
jgi:hypothetical protein